MGFYYAIGIRASLIGANEEGGRWQKEGRAGGESGGGNLRFISAFSTIPPDLEEIRGGGEGRDE